MPEFIKGKDLCRGFFWDIAQSILKENFPDLQYTAGLLGYGSDILGYDDAISTDHMWGPRFYLFLEEKEIHRKEQILDVFSKELPYTYRGYSVHFSSPDPNDNGVRHGEYIEAGRVNPLIFMYTPESFLKEYIGKTDVSHLEPLDWLSFSEHRLLALSKRELYWDALHLQEKLKGISYYPETVWLYLLASCWAVIGQEQAFVKRCGMRGDDIGSRIICGRIAERLMRLCFLYTKSYAPYSKWFGTAFSNLPIDSKIKENIGQAMAADTIQKREKALVQAQALVGEMHNQSDVTEPVSFSITHYFNRDIQVIYADRFAEAIYGKLKGTIFEKMPPVGTFSQIGNFTAAAEPVIYQKAVANFYRSLALADEETV